MAAAHDEGIVLRLTDFRETSQIAALFTAAHGQIRLIAKGVRRGTRARVAPGLDLLERGELSFLPPRGEADLGTLTEWVQRDAFTGLRRDPARLYGALYAAEATLALTEPAEPAAVLYTGLRGLLENLAGKAEPAAALVAFQRVLLRAAGYAPHLESCVECGRPPRPGEAAYFSSAAGGLLCRDCEIHHVEKRRIADALRGTRPEDGPAVEWFALLDYHIAEVAGKRLRTADAVTRLLRAGT